MVGLLSVMRKRGTKRARTTAVQPRPVLARAYPQTPTGLPARLRVRMGYADAKQLTSGASTVSTNIYRLNSVYDPDYSGVGAQAIGYDQYSALYGRYLVTKAFIELWGHNNNGVDSIITAGVHQDLTTFTSQAAQLAEVADGDTKVIYSYQTTPVGYKKWSVDLAKLTGVSKSTYASDSQYQSSIGNSPTSNMGLIIALGAPQGVASSAQACYMIKITYECEWFDPITQSLN